MSQDITLARRATFIRKNGVLYPENPNDIVAFSSLGLSAKYAGTTTNVTQTELLIVGQAVTRFTVPANTSIAFFARVLGQKVGGTQVYHATIEGTIKQIASVATTAFVGNPEITVISGDTLGWDVTVTADTTNGTMDLLVTGANSTTIHWVAEITSIQAS